MKNTAAILLAIALLSVSDVSFAGRLYEESTPAPPVATKNGSVRVVSTVKKDAAPRRHLQQEVTTYTSREAYDSAIGGFSTYCVGFDSFAPGEEYPLTTQPLYFQPDGFPGKDVFILQSNVESTTEPSAGSVGSSGHVEFYTNNFSAGEEPLGTWNLTMILFQQVTAWGGDFTFANVGELLDMEIEYSSGGTIVVPVEIDAAGSAFFFGFTVNGADGVDDDGVSRITFKSRNSVPGAGQSFQLDNICAVVPLSCFPRQCDFSALTPNAFDNFALYSACNFNADPTSLQYSINVFNSSNIKSSSWRDDPDLGSPNGKCNPKGPGIGVGGRPNASFPNCDPLGNLLIIQNPAVTTAPNDYAKGGCMSFSFFDFGSVVKIDDFGLLDIEEGANVTFFTNSVSHPTLTIPKNTAGNNGHWIASKTVLGSEFLSSLDFVNQVEICLKGSGAVSFFDHSQCSNGFEY